MGLNLYPSALRVKKWKVSKTTILYRGIYSAENEFKIFLFNYYFTTPSVDRDAESLVYSLNDLSGDLKEPTHLLINAGVVVCHNKLCSEVRREPCSGCRRRLYVLLVRPRELRLVIQRHQAVMLTISCISHFVLYSNNNKLDFQF